MNLLIPPGVVLAVIAIAVFQRISNGRTLRSRVLRGVATILLLVSSSLLLGISVSPVGGLNLKWVGQKKVVFELHTIHSRRRKLIMARKKLGIYTDGKEVVVAYSEGTYIEYTCLIPPSFGGEVEAKKFYQLYPIRVNGVVVEPGTKEVTDVAQDEVRTNGKTIVTTLWVFHNHVQYYQDFPYVDQPKTMPVEQFIKKYPYVCTEVKVS